jgi:hypothetical protein
LSTIGVASVSSSSRTRVRADIRHPPRQELSGFQIARVIAASVTDVRRDADRDSVPMRRQTHAPEVTPSATPLITQPAPACHRRTQRERLPRTGHNRWHPDIEPVLEVEPGELVVLMLRAIDGDAAR